MNPRMKQNMKSDQPVGGDSSAPKRVAVVGKNPMIKMMAVEDCRTDHPRKNMASDCKMS